MLTVAGQRSICNFQASFTKIGAIALSFVRKGDRAFE